MAEYLATKFYEQCQGNSAILQAFCVAISYVEIWQGNLVVIAGNLVEKIGVVARNL